MRKTETLDTFDRLFTAYGFEKKRGGYGIKRYFHKEKKVYAYHDTFLKHIGIGDDDLRYSVAEVKKHLDDNGFKCDETFDCLYKLLNQN